MDRKTDRKKIKRLIFDIVLIVGLAILHALNFQLFVVHNRFAPSGINGIGTMIEYKFGFSMGYFSLIVNIPLCIIAYFFVNKEFALKSFLFTLIYSIAYVSFGKMDLSAFAYDAKGTDVILPVLAAAIIGGFVYGTVFKRNASSGGTDIIGKLISTRKPEFNFVWVIFCLNIVVAGISYFVYGVKDDTGKIIYDFKPVILCIIYCFVSSRLGNSLLQGSKQAIKFEVVTDSPEELSAEIMNELKHGVTLTKVTGMYSHNEKAMLTCVVNKHQLNDFQKILEKYPNTFAYISSINSTFGNFKKIKK